MTRAFVILLLLCPLLGKVSLAEDAPRRIRQRVDLDFKQTPVAEAIAEIERKTGRVILVDPELKARVTIRLRNVNWRQALVLIAERAGCELQQRGVHILLTRPKDKKSIVISPEVKGTITLRLEGVSAARALRAVVKTAGDYVVVAEGSGPWRTIPSGGRSGAAEAEVGDDATPLKERGLERVLEGTLAGLEIPKQGRPAILLEVREGKETVRTRLLLANDPVIRSLQLRLLRTLEVGTRVVLGVESSKAGLIATHLVAPTPTKSSSPKKAPTPRPKRPAQTPRQ